MIDGIVMQGFDGGSFSAQSLPIERFLGVVCVSLHSNDFGAAVRGSGWIQRQLACLSAFECFAGVRLAFHSDVGDTRLLVGQRSERSAHTALKLNRHDGHPVVGGTGMYLPIARAVASVDFAPFARGLC